MRFAILAGFITFLAPFIANAEADQESRRKLKIIRKMPMEEVKRPLTSYGNLSPEEGPWPECVGQTGAWCQDYIAEWVGYGQARAMEARQLSVVNIIRPYEYVRSRVWIHCDDEGKVMVKPIRG